MLKLLTFCLQIRVFIVQPIEVPSNHGAQMDSFTPNQNIYGSSNIVNPNISKPNSKQLIEPLPNVKILLPNESNCELFETNHHSINR